MPGPSWSNDGNVVVCNIAIGRYGYLEALIRLLIQFDSGYRHDGASEIDWAVIYGGAEMIS